MNKTEERVTINEQNKAENNNTICLLKNADMHLFCFQEIGMWLWCEQKEAYDYPNICCNCYFYNFKVIAYQILLHHST